MAAVRRLRAAPAEPSESELLTAQLERVQQAFYDEKTRPSHLPPAYSQRFSTNHEEPVMSSNIEIPSAVACEDCPAEVSTRRDIGIAGPVRIVTVTHAASCPWLARVASEGVTMARSEGVLIHTAADDVR